MYVGRVCTDIFNFYEYLKLLTAQGDFNPQKLKGREPQGSHSL